MVLTPPPLALWVAPVADLGGVARHFLDVAGVGIPGWRVMFFTPAGPLADELTRRGHAVLTDTFGPDAGFARSVASLRATVAAVRPAVVHTHLSYADIVAPAATAGLGVRLVTTEHGIAADDRVYHGSAARSRLMAGVHTARLRAFDASIAVAEATRTAMRAKWHARGVRLVRNGVDPVDHAPTASGLRVASLARLAPEKRIDVLLRAFRLVVDAHPTARLTVAGSGPLAAELQKLAADLGLNEAVTFVGHVDAAGVLATHDVLAQLSVWENCSYALLDAVTHGLGVVATPVGGNPEILPERCLVESDPQQVAAAILRQGLEVEERPALPKAWPTMNEMTAQVAQVYAEVVA